MSTKRALRTELRQYRNAERLFELGARVPIVFEMTRLSSWFLRKLSLEIRGEAPRKGQIPNSDQWYLRRQNNLQASLFYALYENLPHPGDGDFDDCDRLVAAYSQFRDSLLAADLECVLSIDRAWWLVKSVAIRNLRRYQCRHCKGRYIHGYGRLERSFLCPDCCGTPA
jgi:flagellar transcriptional activator FlhC